MEKRYSEKRKRHYRRRKLPSYGNKSFRTVSNIFCFLEFSSTSWITRSFISLPWLLQIWFDWDTKKISGSYLGCVVFHLRRFISVIVLYCHRGCRISEIGENNCHIMDAIYQLSTRHVLQGNWTNYIWYFLILLNIW